MIVANSFRQIFKYMFLLFVVVLYGVPVIAEPLTLEDIKNKLEADPAETGSENAAGTIADTAYLAVNTGTPVGASLDMTASSQIHTYELHSKAVSSGAEAFITIGYKKRY